MTGGASGGRLQVEERRGPGGDPPSARRSHAALAPREDACAAAWEMDTVEGAQEDSACLLTLLHRPSRLQRALPLAEKTAGASRPSWAISGRSSAPTGRAACSAPCSPTTAPGFDETLHRALLGEGPGDEAVHCDPRRSDQSACERNPSRSGSCCPKGAGIRFDRLVQPTWALAMSHVNLSPRALGFATPARAFRAMRARE